MICRKFSYNEPADWPAIENWLKLRIELDISIEESVSQILSLVKEKGDRALLEYTRRFDSPDFSLSQLKLPQESLQQAPDLIPQKDLEIIKESIGNIRSYHEKQRENSWIQTQAEGCITGQIVRPVKKAGLYIPGGMSGDTPLISSLIMNAVPAQTAGVEKIIVTSPPRKDGTLNPYTLATAQMLGITDIYALGSAWAVGALAFGTESIPCVDIITGPGNIYVTTAKRLLVGKIGIDMIAGPSEITVLADESADPDWLAADLLSQAEHDLLSSCLCISPESKLLDEVSSRLEHQLKDLPKKDTARHSLQNWGGLIEVKDLSAGLELINKISPEHLELCINNPWDWLDSIDNAGAVFLGHYAPESLGDYFAGPNHVLPTLGTARFSSALSVDHFTKKINLLASSRLYMQIHGSKVSRLARIEGLEAHARSAEKRYLHSNKDHR